MSHAKRVTLNNKQNREYHAVIAIKRLWIDKICPVENMSDQATRAKCSSSTRKLPKMLVFQTKFSLKSASIVVEKPTLRCKLPPTSLKLVSLQNSNGKKTLKIIQDKLSTSSYRCLVHFNPC